MTVTWTSGYAISEAYPFVEWGMKGSHPGRAPASTVTFGRDSLCGMVPMKICVFPQYACTTPNWITICHLLKLMCLPVLTNCAGEPASTVGWRDPGFIHTSFLKNLSADKE
jgi:hypothetical protein